MIAVTEQPAEFHETPIFDRVMAEHPVELDTPTSEPGTLPGERDTHPASAVGEHADGWPKREEFELGGPTTAEILASIEVDYDELYPSQVAFTEAFQAWLADRSQPRRLAIAPVIDVPDSFYEESEDGPLVPADRTVIIVPVGEPDTETQLQPVTSQTLVQITKP